MEYQRGNKLGLWKPKASMPVPSEEQMRRMVTPEMASNRCMHLNLSLIVLYRCVCMRVCWLDNDIWKMLVMVQLKMMVMEMVI
jgi:hypothetical protein